MCRWPKQSARVAIELVTSSVRVWIDKMNSRESVTFDPPHGPTASGRSEPSVSTRLGGSGRSGSTTTPRSCRWNSRDLRTGHRWIQVDGTRLQSVLQASYIRKHNQPTRYQSTSYRRPFAPDISENPRVGSSILPLVIVNQRLTRFWVVTIRTTFVLHEGGPAMVPPLTFGGWGRCSTRFTTDTVGNPSVDNGVGWYVLDGTQTDLRTT